MKDKITNIIVLIVLVGGAINAYLQSTSGTGINWIQLVMVVATAVIGWYTGKNPDGSKPV
jgi:hypothetical protein